jgi:hypothetical protein
MDIINIIFIAVLVVLALPMIVLIGINLCYRIRVEYTSDKIIIFNYNDEEKANEEQKV